MDSFISWVGGKKALRKKILGQFPAGYGRYIEAFGGAGWTLFAQERKGKLEVYNDMDGNLVNLFRCVKRHPDAIQEELDWLLNAREIFFDAREERRGLTDIQRAAQFFILIKESYGVDCRSFGASNRDMAKAVAYMRQASARLNKVVVERMDFERLLKVYDRPDALFYLDPPYFGAEKHYNVKFGSNDHTRLRDALGRADHSVRPFAARTSGGNAVCAFLFGRRCRTYNNSSSGLLRGEIAALTQFRSHLRYFREGRPMRGAEGPVFLPVRIKFLGDFLPLFQRG